eukprot:569190-Amphidinium_carterae.1
MTIFDASPKEHSWQSNFWLTVFMSSMRPAPIVQHTPLRLNKLRRSATGRHVGSFATGSVCHPNTRELRVLRRVRELQTCVPSSRQHVWWAERKIVLKKYISSVLTEWQGVRSVAAVLAHEWCVCSLVGSMSNLTAVIEQFAKVGNGLSEKKLHRGILLTAILPEYLQILLSERLVHDQGISMRYRMVLAGDVLWRSVVGNGSMPAIDKDTLLNPWVWTTQVGCAAHDCHNALKWRCKVAAPASPPDVT